jgi:hypothetical protein
MNAQAEIITSFTAETTGGKVFIEKGAIYDGTLNGLGIFFFHATNESGRICEVRIEEGSPFLKIKKFAKNRELKK